MGQRLYDTELEHGKSSIHLIPRASEKMADGRAVVAAAAAAAAAAVAAATAVAALTLIICTHNLSLSLSLSLVKVTSSSSGWSVFNNDGLF